MLARRDCHHEPVDTTSSPLAGPRRRRARVALLVAVVLVVLVLGYQSGLRSSWSAHHPRLVDGEAMRNGNGDQDTSAVFTGKDGTHELVQLDRVAWRSGQRTGDGTDGLPPCLRTPGVKAAVQVGVIELARPYGEGSYRQVLSLTCR